MLQNKYLFFYKHVTEKDKQLGNYNNVIQLHSKIEQ